MRFRRRAGARGRFALNTLVSLGRFVPGATPLHRLDARFKLIAVLLLATAVVTSARLTIQIGLCVAFTAMFAGARLPVHLALRSLRGALWLALFVVVANVGWAWIAQRAAWAAGEGSLADAAGLTSLVLRLVNLLFLATLLTATTVPLDAAEAVQRLLRPLQRWRFPVHDVGMLLGLALSFVPLFQREATALVDAHRTKRGGVRWGITDRLRAAIPLLVPLFLAVLRRADDVAIALDARCYRPGTVRTSLVAGRRGGGEWIALGVAAAALAVAIRWR